MTMHADGLTRLSKTYEKVMIVRTPEMEVRVTVAPWVVCSEWLLALLQLHTLQRKCLVV